MGRLSLVILTIASFFGSTLAQNDTPIKIWIVNSAPVDLLLSVNPLFESGKYIWTSNLDEADLALDYEQQAGVVTTRWLYVPVVPFAHTAEQVRWEDVRRYWAGDLAALSYLTPTRTPPELVVSSETLRALVSVLGNPAVNVPFHYAETTDAIPELLWNTRPNGWGVMSFSQLTPILKVLTLDRFDVFGDGFDLEAYPLTTYINLKGDEAKLGLAIEDLLKLGSWQPSNRNPEQLSRVVLTGVTALTRATAAEMEERGITVPAEGILPFLSDSDLLHTSNEVSFSENCGYPDRYGGVIFCSRDSYLELLTYIGLDVVELTGNHINDYGAGAFRRTLDIYDQNGIATFGGGRTVEDARDAYITTIKGTSIAFIGCNVAGPFGAWASEYQEGAARCDDAYLEQEIPRLAQTVDIVILTFQEYEQYTYTPPAAQVRNFEKYAALGADVVIGSQAHQPQGFTFSNGAFLHHGLGNLFFDQMQNIYTRQMFADKLILYDGRLINVVLFTGLIEDFCCPRPMTAAERETFLTTIFQASGW